MRRPSRAPQTLSLVGDLGDRRARGRAVSHSKPSPARAALAVLVLGGAACLVAGAIFVQANFLKPVLPGEADGLPAGPDHPAPSAEPSAEEPPGAEEAPPSADGHAQGAGHLLDFLSGSGEATLFDADVRAERVLGPSEIPEVTSALQDFDTAGLDVGFVMIDLKTHRGMSYNSDEGFFSASTVKAPFVAYIAQDLIDAGQVSPDEDLYEDLKIDGTGVMATDGIDHYSLKTVLYNTIVHSDNTGYGLLREHFSRKGFESWCADAGVDAEAWQGEWYPSYSARDLAKLWLDISSYLAGGSGYGSWCADLFQRTDSSFLREALGAKNQVLAKPGYETNVPGIVGGALNDAGLVMDDDGGGYVLAILSDADYDDRYLTGNEHLIVDLASALGAAHDRLLVEGGVT